ncbi:MAG: hypothetical protein CL910_12505, partial [Deltaproteobacteria bacterium]|nr:hypothetical protein [Deltaproteobacteria bacterium]
MTRWIPFLSMISMSGLALAVVLGCGEGGLDATLATTTDPSTLRTTRLGSVVGGVTPSGAHAWRGIPFAEPPVGDLSWRAPRPVV